jgi:TetR/AcrR family transcriptional regulator
MDDRPEAPAAAAAPARRVRGVSRARAQTLASINRAAIEVFARDGLPGATTQAIADAAGLSKARLHYHIESKEALYRQVLQDIVDDWIGVFGFADEAHGPRKVLSEYVRRKMLFSLEQPLRSRVFAAEMMRGAPVLRDMMTQSKRRTEQAVAVIRSWIHQGLMEPVDPLVLMFNIWAATQFYAEHMTQVQYFTGESFEQGPRREWLISEVTALVLRGAGVK